MSELLVPTEVAEAYLPDDPGRLRKLGNGMINLTLLAEGSQGPFVLQRLSPIFSAETVYDHLIVADHLQRDGWSVAHPVPTAKGDLYTRDRSNTLWRAQEYLSCDQEQDRPLDLSTWESAGSMLGRLHTSLKKLEYEPRFQLPHFHDTAYYAHELEKALPSLPTSDGKMLTRDILYAYGTIEALPDDAEQLIHGDPRTANMLFQHGKPYTFIDWDTLMKGPVWLDIGDMLRSVAEDEIQKSRDLPIGPMLAIIEGYRQAARPEASVRAFRSDALRAAQLLAIELAMRFAADYKDGSEGYFLYDSQQYSDRHAFTKERAAQQMEIYRQIGALNGIY